MEFEKLKPLHPLTKEEEKLNKDNKWLASISEDKDYGSRAIRKPRLPGRAISRSQRIAIINEKYLESGNILNRKQRKAHG